MIRRYQWIWLQLQKSSMRRKVKNKGITASINAQGCLNEAVILQDMAGGYSYIYLVDGIPAATFAFFYGEDPTYKVITEGQWLTDNPYTVIHRITDKRNIPWSGRSWGNRSYGLGRIGVKEAIPACASIRIPTTKACSGPCRKPLHLLWPWS